MLEVSLPVYAIETGSCSPRRAPALRSPRGRACEDTASRLLAHAGVAGGRRAGGGSAALDELAAAGRALRQLEAGDFGRAWREVESKLSPTAMRIREDIAAEQERPHPADQRARVLAVTGDGLGAWTLLAPVFAPARPRRRLPILAPCSRRRRPTSRAAIRAPPGPAWTGLLAIRPDDAELQLELGRVSMLQGDPEGARAALARSAELDPARLPWLVLAEIDAGDPRRHAQHLLAAGRREAERLNPQRAEHLFERAIELIPSGEPEPARDRLDRSADRRPAEALAAFDAAREAGDADAEVFAGLGVAQRRLGQPAAEASLRRALALEPDHGEAFASSRRSAPRGGRGGRGLLERALALEPQRAEPRRALARALHASGEPAAAMRVLASPDASDTAAAAPRRRGDPPRAGGLPAAQAELRARSSSHLTTRAAARARVGRRQGDAGARARPRQLAQVLDDAPGAAEAETAGRETGTGLGRSLVASFATRSDEGQAPGRAARRSRAREPAAHLWSIGSPRLPDLTALRAALERDLSKRFT